MSQADIYNLKQSSANSKTPISKTINIVLKFYGTLLERSKLFQVLPELDQNRVNFILSKTCF